MLRAIDDPPELLDVSTRQRAAGGRNDLLALRQEVIEPIEQLRPVEPFAPAGGVAGGGAVAGWVGTMAVASLLPPTVTTVPSFFTPTAGNIAAIATMSRHWETVFPSPHPPATTAVPSFFSPRVIAYPAAPCGPAVVISQHGLLGAERRGAGLPHARPQAPREYDRLVGCRAAAQPVSSAFSNCDSVIAQR